MTVATIRPLQRPVPLRQSVYDALIDLIVGGELPPGQHMVETELARQLGVSRQPTRQAQLARLREICGEGQAAAEADDFGSAVAANNAFHAEIAVMGGNAVLAELAGIVGRRVQWYYRMVAPARGHGSWTEHAEMIDVIEAGDPERAQALARKHTERTRQAYHQPRSAG